MARARSVHRCRGCGSVTSRWAGRCPSCGAWNTLSEELLAAPSSALASTRSPGGPDADGPRSPFTADLPQALGDVDLAAAVARPTGLDELDRVLGGGLVPGSVTLIGGEPGVGKSTLLLQVLAEVAGRGERVLLVSAEESAQQVRLRAERLGSVPSTLRLLESTDVGALAVAMAAEKPALVVVDSIQAVADGSVAGGPGSLAQVRACADILVRQAKQWRIPFVLVGHVTKDGSLAGPRALEHLVDTVVTVEGDRHHALRLVRAVKHRFGPTGELGLFEMSEAGLRAVGDPYRLLLGDRRPGAPGSAILPAVEGQRALLVEVQALTSPSGAAPCRRTAQGVDGGRLGLLLAVLENQARVNVRNTDVYCSAVGGIRVVEPAADLALSLAVASAVAGVALPANLVVFGEVGLTGEIRQVPHAARRLVEAARVGFRHAVVPFACPSGPSGMELVHVHTLSQA
ncbi:MAG TPA: DNA repair protein RadA, partial [Acidimicrobiales bacterium]|nr:DNA repair protein RadA [Acidimicrobiales bacterium]